ncbi:TPA: hypothetical protein NJ874_002179 [Vibrio parahaemolyticus]|nr:hypothetical protein [Vibrio parahaemolyticus]
MNVWKGNSFESIMLVKPDDIELFHLEIEDSGRGALEKAFSLSHSCLSDNDVLLVRKSLSSNKKNFSDRLTYIEEINDLFNRREFSQAYNFLKAHKGISHVEGVVCSSLKELSFLMSLFYNLFSQGPINSNSIWVNSGLGFAKKISDVVSEAKVSKCPITSFLSQNKDKLDRVSEAYTSSKPEVKLKIISSCFLIACELEKQIGNIAVSTIYLHRALETLFISWLLEDREITLTEDGKVRGDKYLYLLDYLDMVKKERAISSEEEKSIRELNTIRNESKLAHGYFEPSTEQFDTIFSIIKKVMANDYVFVEYYQSLNESLEIPYNIYSLIENFLIEKSYLKKLAL